MYVYGSAIPMGIILNMCHISLESLGVILIFLVTSAGFKWAIKLQIFFVTDTKHCKKRILFCYTICTVTFSLAQ